MIFTVYMWHCTAHLASPAGQMCTIVGHNRQFFVIFNKNMLVMHRF